MEGPLVGLAAILVIGVGAQWLAWRMHLPSILVLLVAGILAGPVTGFLDPDALFGDLLLPIVSVSVGIILFEGGLSLRFSEITEHGAVVRRLISVGAVVTWVTVTAGAYLLTDLGLGLSVLMGAILIVTGPTVILPLLRHVRPTKAVGSVLKWEGILNDPVGAILAVLVFEALLAGTTQEATTIVLLGVLKAVAIGSVVGLLMAFLLLALLRRRLVPEHLHSPVSLMLVVAAFAAANTMQSEAGLLAVTIAGIALANQRSVDVAHIVEFKENLRVLLIAGLFILLSARLTRADLAIVGTGTLLFLAFVMLVARPASVLASTTGSALTWRERAFLGWVAPRGIVAAAVASFFGLRLSEAGYPGAEALSPLMFLVIVGTVAAHGLTARPFARVLGLAKPPPEGVLLVGAHPWSRDLARSLHEAGVHVVVADTNPANVHEARALGLATHAGSVLAEDAMDTIDLENVGRLLAVTPNDEVNALATLRFADVLGRDNVFLLSTSRREGRVARDLRGRTLFAKDLTSAEITRRVAEGWRVEASPVPDTGAPEEPKETRGIPLFLVDEGGAVHVYTPRVRHTPRPGQTVVRLVPPRSPTDSA